MSMIYRSFGQAARRTLMTFALILVASNALQAQSGWKTIKDATGACQISIPPSWSTIPGTPGQFASPEHLMSILLPGYPRKAAPMTDDEKRVMGAVKIIENSAEYWLYTGKPTMQNVITYHVNVPTATRVCAAELAVKVGHSEDEIKKIADTVRASK